MTNWSTRKLREKASRLRQWVGLKDYHHETETQAYQNLIRDALKKYFGDEVRKEWSVASDATDAFRNKSIYAPRLDIAVGPFNTKIETLPENQRKVISQGITHPFVRKLLDSNKDLVFEKLNRNPRCLLAIEISFSGSSKHILGDFTNASMMGLIGIVIAGKRNYSKVIRILNYLKLVRHVGKAPSDLFLNLIVYNLDDFWKLL